MLFSTELSFYQRLLLTLVVHIYFSYPGLHTIAHGSPCPFYQATRQRLDKVLRGCFVRFSQNRSILPQERTRGMCSLIFTIFKNEIFNFPTIHKTFVTSVSDRKSRKPLIQESHWQHTIYPQCETLKPINFCHFSASRTI